MTAAIKVLVAAGADINDPCFLDDWTPLKTAIDSVNAAVTKYLESVGAKK